MKKKIYIELILTLVVGFVIGFFVNSIITDRKIENYTLAHREMGFWKRTLSEIGATEEQKEAIFPIVKEYSSQTREIMHQSWNQIPPIWEKMNVEIIVHLTDVQQKELEKIQAKRASDLEQRMKKRKQGNNEKEHSGEHSRLKKKAK
jgi:hypothetical protein